MDVHILDVRRNCAATLALLSLANVLRAFNYAQLLHTAREVVGVDVRAHSQQEETHTRRGCISCLHGEPKLSKRPTYLEPMA